MTFYQHIKSNNKTKLKDGYFFHHGYSEILIYYSTAYSSHYLMKSQKLINVYSFLVSLLT